MYFMNLNSVEFFLKVWFCESMPMFYRTALKKLLLDLIKSCNCNFISNEAEQQK